jgi:hypothetical protein
MNLRPHKFSREHTAEPLHQVLLNFSKGLWQWPLKSRTGHLRDVSQDMLLVQYADNAVLHARVRELTIKQLATTLRMRHEHSEEVMMLNSLESLALAGEINFGDFVGRTQNLFPREMELLDVTLRVKIASLMM